MFQQAHNLSGRIIRYVKTIRRFRPLSIAGTQENLLSNKILGWLFWVLIKSSAVCGSSEDLISSIILYRYYVLTTHHKLSFQSVESKSISCRNLYCTEPSNSSLGMKDEMIFLQIYLPFSSLNELYIHRGNSKFSLHRLF